MGIWQERHGWYVNWGDVEISLAFGESNMEFPLRLEILCWTLQTQMRFQVDSKNKKKKASVDKRGVVWEIVWKGWHIHK